MYLKTLRSHNAYWPVIETYLEPSLKSMIQRFCGNS